MSRRKLKVFISSPFLELKEHRDAIKDIVDGWKKERSYEIMTGEKLYDTPGTTADQLRAWVDQCNVFVLLLGAGYGSIGHENKSYTHIEVDHAIERHKNKDLRAFFYFRVLDGKPVDPKKLNAHAAQWNEMSDAAEQAAEHCKETNLAEIQLRLVKALEALVDDKAMAQSRDPDHRPRLDGKDYTYHKYTGLVDKVFVGRERQIKMLTDFAAKRGNFAKKSVLVVEALGGTGKSAMTWKWYNEPLHDCFKGYDMRMRWCFYEAGAEFNVFVEHLYALLWQQPLAWAREQLNSTRRAEYLNSILQELDHRSVLLLLDGLEREFVSHRDAESLENERVSDTFGAAGKGAGAKKPAGHTMRNGSGRYFIEQLASLRASRVVVTTRFTPNELTERGTLLDGAEIMKLGLFTGDDRVHGVELLGRRGIRAPYQSLVKLVDQCGGHPLTLQIVAADVLRPPYNGDLIKFLRDNPGFEPPFDDVVQKRTHVLDYSLRNLGEVDWDVLHVLNINANNGPMEHDEIVREVRAVSAAKRKAIVDSLRALHADRALLEYSALEDAYEMHPVVRGTVRRRLAERRGRADVLEKHEKVVGDIAATAGRGDDAGYYRMAATEDGRRQLNKLISIKLEQGQLDAAAPMAVALASVLARQSNYFGAIEHLLPFLDPDTNELSLTDGDTGVDVIYVLSDALRMVGQYTLAQVLLSRTIGKAESEKLSAKLPDLIELRALCLQPHGRHHDYHRDMKRALELRAEKAGSEEANSTRHAHLVRMLSQVFAVEGRARLSQLALARASRLERGHLSNSLSGGAIGFTRGTRTELLLRAAATGERSAARQSLLLQSRFANHDDGWLKWDSRAFVLSDWSRSWAAWTNPDGMDDADFKNAWNEAVRDYTCFLNLKSASSVRMERARAFLDSGKPEDARRDLVAARADFERHGDEKSSSIVSLLALEARLALETGDRPTAKTKAVEAIRWCADLGQISRGWMPLEDAIAVALQSGGRDLSVGDMQGAIEVDGRRYDFPPLFPWTEDEINPKDQHWVDPALILPVQLY
jgi:hypothetical protein